MCVYSIRSSKSAERIVDSLFTIKFAGHGYDSTTRFSDTTCSVHVVSSVTYMYTVTDRQTQLHVRTSSVACTYVHPQVHVLYTILMIKTTDGLDCRLEYR